MTALILYLLFLLACMAGLIWALVASLRWLKRELDRPYEEMMARHNDRSAGEL